MGDEAVIEGLAARLRLPTEVRRATGMGALLARGPGASLEFHDHRDYQPGDDPRHLDMAAWARTGRPVVRRQRAETSPRVEVLLDASRSMGLTPGKQALAVALAGLILRLGAAGGARPALWILGERAHPVGAAWKAALARWRPESAEPGLPAGLGWGSNRYLVSDGLFREGPAGCVRRLGDGATRLHAWFVRTRDEVQPVPGGSQRLEDIEGGQADLDTGAEACAAYCARLARLDGAWEQALRGRGHLVQVEAESGIEAAVRRGVAAGMLAWRQGA